MQKRPYLKHKRRRISILKPKRRVVQSLQSLLLHMVREIELTVLKRLRDLTLMTLLKRPGSNLIVGLDRGARTV